MALGIPIKRLYKPEPIKLDGKIRLRVPAQSPGLKDYASWVGGFQDWVITPGTSFYWDFYIRHLEGSYQDNIKYAITRLRIRGFGSDVGEVVWPVTWNLTFRGQSQSSQEQTRDDQALYWTFTYPEDDPLIVEYDSSDIPGTMTFSCSSTIPITPDQGSIGRTYGWGMGISDIYGWQI